MSTLPISGSDEVAGKYLASAAVVLISTVLTLLEIVFIGFFGDINYMAVLSALTVYFLFCLLFSAIYLFVTLSVKSFNVSAIVCYAVAVGTFVFGLAGVLLKKVGGGIFEAIARRVSPFLRMDDAVYGFFDLATVVYFLVLTALFLLLGIFISEKKYGNE
jgi:ABC-2 type transport system permease protein